MSFRTDRARVSGLGTAGEGVEHWWVQRLTSVALVPLVLLFLFPFARALGTPHAEVLAVWRDPFNAIIAVLTIGTGFHHLKLGLQVVIEDYVHGSGPRTAALVANTLLCWFLGLSGIFAVARIAFA